MSTIIIIGIALYFFGVFDSEPIKIEPVKNEKSKVIDPTKPVVVVPEKPKYKFKVKDINKKRLNRKLSLLTKYEIIEEEVIPKLEEPILDTKEVMVEEKSEIKEAIDSQKYPLIYNRENQKIGYIDNDNAIMLPKEEIGFTRKLPNDSSKDIIICDFKDLKDLGEKTNVYGTINSQSASFLMRSCKETYDINFLTYSPSPSFSYFCAFSKHLNAIHFRTDTLNKKYQTVRDDIILEACNGTLISTHKEAIFDSVIEGNPLKDETRGVYHVVQHAYLKEWQAYNICTEKEKENI